MTFIFVLAGVIGFCLGAKEPACDLEDDLVEFVDLFPTDEYTAILDDYMKHDAEYKNAHEYMSSDEFARLFADVRMSSEYNTIMKNLNDIGYPGLLNLGEHFEPAPRPPKQPRSGTGFHSLIKDVIDMLPHDDIRKLFERKMESNECFRTFVEKVQGLEFQAHLTEFEKSKEYRAMKEALHKHGVDIHDLYHMYEHVLGFEIFSTIEEPWNNYRVKTEL